MQTLTNCTILTVNGQDTIYPRGRIQIQGRHILAVGDEDDIPLSSHGFQRPIAGNRRRPWRGKRAGQSGSRKAGGSHRPGPPESPSHSFAQGESEQHLWHFDVRSLRRRCV